MIRRLLLSLALLLTCAPAVQAQGTSAVKAIDTVSGATTDVGDATNKAVRVTVQNPTPVHVLSVDGSGTEIVASTLVTHDSPLTPASTTGAATFCRASTTAPTSVSTTDDAVLLWCQPNGSPVFNLAAGGTLITAGSGGGIKIDGSGTALPVSGTVALSNSFLLDATYTGRMPAGASPANGESNTNTALSRIGGYNFIYNGSTWDRWTGAVTGSGNFTVTQGTGTNLHMVCDSGCSSSSAPADEATFTPGTTSQTPVGGFFQTTATNNALTTGQMGAFQVTANRALFTNLRNASGTELGVAAAPLQVSLANTAANATAVKVDGSAVTQPVSGTVAVSNSFLLDATFTGRMPAGASPANGESNTNTALSRIGGYNFIYNGSTWDRWTGAVTANAGTNLNTSALALDATVTGRLPAGGSPADAESNTNTNLSRIGGYNFLFNGTSWDRQRGDTTNGAFVNVKTSVLPTNAAAETGGNLATIKTNTDRPTTVTQGQKTVAVTNTAVALATTTTIKSVTAKALSANAGTVYVGGSGVTTANGFALGPNDTVSLGIADLATVFINGTSGDGVSFVAVN